MIFKTLIPLALVCFAAPAAFGQQKIGVANPGRIFSEMQETKDLKENLESERVRLTSMEKEKRDALQALQNQRNQLKADSPTWDELNNKLNDAALEFQMWGQQTKIKAERNQKKQMKVLFGRIEQAIGEVAKRDGYDLVLADQHPELPENLDQINFDQLRALINTRNVLYASPKSDVSDAVIAMLDSRYKTKGGATGAPAGSPAAAPTAAPTPPPTGAPAPGSPRRAAPAPTPRPQP